MLLPPMTDDDLLDVFTRLNGILLIGGRDYSPNLYGQQEHLPSVNLIHRLREEFDLRLINLAMNRTDLPILGICGGCQLLNIALGGSLIQDIACEIPSSSVIHSRTNGCANGFTTHPVRLEPETSLQKIYSIERLDVPTSHHQAVKVLGKGLIATAFAEDDVIEAVELPGRRFVVGVQWHPERDFDNNKSLFEEFVKEASRVTVAKR